MKKLIKLALGAVLATGTASTDTLIHANSLIDGDASRTVNNRTIRISGNVIMAIEDGFSEPADGDTIIDLRN